MKEIENWKKQKSQQNFPKNRSLKPWAANFWTHLFPILADIGTFNTKERNKLWSRGVLQECRNDILSCNGGRGAGEGWKKATWLDGGLRFNNTLTTPGSIRNRPHLADSLHCAESSAPLQRRRVGCRRTRPTVCHCLGRGREKGERLPGMQKQGHQVQRSASISKPSGIRNWDGTELQAPRLVHRKPLLQVGHEDGVSGHGEGAYGAWGTCENRLRWGVTMVPCDSSSPRESITPP